MVPSIEGTNLCENVLFPSNVVGLDEAWRYSTRGLIEPSPAVANGIVYEGFRDDNLSALDAATGP